MEAIIASSSRRLPATTGLRPRYFPATTIEPKLGPRVMVLHGPSLRPLPDWVRPPEEPQIGLPPLGTTKIGHLNHDLVGPGRKIQSNLILVRLGSPRYPVSMNFLAIQPHHNGVIGSQEQRHHFGDLEINLAAKQLVCAGRKIERGHDTISDVDGCPFQICLRDILGGEGRLIGVVIKWTGHFPKAHVQSEDFGLGRSSDPKRPGKWATCCDSNGSGLRVIHQVQHGQIQIPRTDHRSA